jgi:hypothetical protein
MTGATTAGSAPDSAAALKILLMLLALLCRRRLAWRARHPAGLAIPVEQPVPVRFAEVFGRHLVGDLFQRPAQPHEIPITPHARPPESSPIEVDEIHRIISDEQDVVRVQVRVTHAEIVERANAASDGDPAENRKAPPAQGFGERHRIRQPLGDEICGVERAMAAVARGDRRRHRKPRAMQVIQELPLCKGARRRLVPPEISVAHKLRKHAPAPIVTQDELLLARAHEIGRATAAGLTLDFVALLPVGGVEPAGCRVARPGRVI